MRSIHEGITFNCDHYHYKAKWKSNLLQHVQSLHEGITFNCKHYDSEANNKRSIGSHIKSIQHKVKH